jgi:TrmH family RNA methyltransferase
MAHPSGGTVRSALRGNISPITSRENRWLKRFRAALAGDRTADEAVGVEGVRLVEAALGSNLPVETVLVSESGARHLPRLGPLLASGVKLLRTSDKLFAGVADTKTPQGIAALVRPRVAAIENLATGTALVTVLVGVQDPGNVGTIIRTAEAFGATGAATCPAGGIGPADPFSPKALRASAGSALRLPIAHAVSLETLLSKLRAARVKLYAAVADPRTGNVETEVTCTPSGVLRPWDIDWKKPAALFIGNEGAGLPAEFVRAADGRVSIPQAAGGARVGIESLNAAMAASVLLYEAMRQRTMAEERDS